MTLQPVPGPETTLRSTLPAALSVVCIGSLWGLYWVPLRRLESLASAGPWTTLVVVCIGCLCLAPSAWKGRCRLKAANNRALGSIALGGASFVLYSDGLLYGRVAVVILLFYLTPVWSTLIVRFWLKWPVSAWRYAAIGSGLVGITLVMKDSHPGGLPLPRDLGDLFGLASGLLWSVASTGMYVHSRTRPAETNFIFCCGGAAMAAILALTLAPPPDPGLFTIPAAAIWALLIGCLWWALSLTAFMWATRTLEPARIGLLLMSEVIVGAASAALVAEEPFTLVILCGAILVIAAGFLESVPAVLNSRDKRRLRGDTPDGQATQKRTRTFF